jgi:diamine N-acetyltransferase
MPKLRELQIKDSELMYEWISDYEVTNQLAISRFPYSMEQINKFIQNSWNDKENIHFAIVNDEDEYIGTVSLKNINMIDRNAEYAIVIRKKFWGEEFSKFATEEILNYGFSKLNLHKIYLNVLSTNVRANKFYEKIGFEKENTFREHMFLNGEYVDLNWFSIFNK